MIPLCSGKTLRRGDMQRSTISGWDVLLALAVSLAAAACGDDDDSACKNGTPSCAVGFDHFNEKTCTCERSVDASLVGSMSCERPPSTHDAGTNIVACMVARASLECPAASGGGCDCLSDDLKSCSACGASTTCSNRCETHEYTMWCGGPPLRDGGSYAEAPASCRSITGFPSGAAIY